MKNLLNLCSRWCLCIVVMLRSQIFLDFTLRLRHSISHIAFSTHEILKPIIHRLLPLPRKNDSRRVILHHIVPIWLVMPWSNWIVRQLQKSLFLLCFFTILNCLFKYKLLILCHPLGRWYIELLIGVNRLIPSTNCGAVDDFFGGELRLNLYYIIYRLYRFKIFDKRYDGSWGLQVDAWRLLD